jgi:CheY-like chemotaxis protein/curved DNA-binding protein CbpA
MPHRVLVVDDEESIRALVKDYLEGLGYEVVTASDGDEGIKVFKDQSPHIALIDFLLPRKNGFAVAEAIRRDETRANTPIIMMSGVFKNPKTAVEAREKYRVVDFLSKPLDMDRIASLVQNALSGTPAALDVSAKSKPGLPAPSTSPSNGKAASSPGVLSAPDAPPARGLSYMAKPSTSGPSGGGGLPAAKARTPPPRMASSTADGMYLRRPFPELGEEEGELEKIPVAMLLSIIRYDTLTGMLDLTDQGTHRRIYIVKGQPTFMQSNAEGENVGALLLRRGRITEPDFQRCLAYMKTKGRTLQQSLLELRLANEHDLSTAYKLLAGQLLPLALGMASGKYKWRETDAFIGRVPEGNFEPMQVLFEGIKRHVHPPQILKFFKGREDVPMLRTTEFEKLMPFFRRAFSANNIANEIAGKITYREITRKHANQAASVVPQLFGLVTSGMVVLPELSEKNRVEIAVNAAAAEINAMSENIDFEDGSPAVSAADEDDADFSPEEKRARTAIFRYHEDVMSKDFFQIFGVNADADNERIKTLYFDLAKRWHQDAYAEMNLGSARQKLDEIFARITEAYETITDKPKKEEYLVYLDRQAKGLPTDPNQILRAENMFDQALALIRRRDWNGAKQVIEEAIKLNPGDPLYYANLGWVIFNADPKSQDGVTKAVQLLKRALQESEHCAVAYQYLGQIASTRGQIGEARKWWQKCLELEPNNIEASRGLRMLSSREDKERQSKSGLLGKFLNKK